MTESLPTILDRFRRELLVGDAAVARRLIDAYGEAWTSILTRLNRLTAQIEAARAAGETINLAWLHQQARLSTLLDQVALEIARFGGTATGAITGAQSDAVTAALSHAETLMSVALGPPPSGVAVTFSRLPRSAVQNIVGAMGDGSPLRDIFAGFGPSAVESARRALVTGVATGQGPRVIARQLRESLGGDLVRALTIARTECLPGDTVVDGAVVDAIYRRWYEGPMVKIVTEGGREFSATPNHPMLTRRGWVAAGEITVGDGLIGNSGQQQASAAGYQDVEAPPATLREIFDALSAVGVSERRRTSQPDFHGDGREGYVDILSPTGRLQIGRFTPLYKPVIQNLFSPSNLARTGFCNRCHRLLPINKGTCGCVRSERETSFFQSGTDQPGRYPEAGRYFGGRLPLAISISDLLWRDVTAVARRTARAGILDLPHDAGFTDDFSCKSPPSGFPSDLIQALTSEVKLNHVASVSISMFVGHVYNLSTPYGYFTINGGTCTGNTLRAYRETSRQTYQANREVVGYWVWSASLSTRTCGYCWAQHGSVHPLDERMTTHPACRCSMSPRTKSWAELGFTGVPDSRPVIRRGEDLFARLKPEAQIAVLAPGKFALYQDGRLRLNDLIAYRDDPRWGRVGYEKALKDL